MNNSLFLAKKTKEWQCAYLSSDFVPNLKVEDQKGDIRKFYKILWDYIPDSDSKVLKWIGEEIGEISQKLKAEIILGMESSGIHYAALAAIHAKKAFGFIRKSKKDYGLKRIIEGSFGKRKEVLLVDNFVFTGGTILRGVNTLEDYGLKLKGVVSVDCFDNLRKVDGFKNLPFTSLVKNSEKINTLLKLGYFPGKLTPFIKKYVNSPDLYFAPSKIHEEYVSILSSFSKLKFVVLQENREHKLGYKLLRKLNFLKKN